jgi:trans-2,3-dihydro-3-hydroxyanthranilate isomerase
MKSHPFHIVDVFTTERFAGNQLAVFQEASTLSDGEMQSLAQEMNYSEVTFIESLETRDGGYDVRIFDPVVEMEFAGHPTLGTAYVLREHILDDPPDDILLNLRVGQIPVRVESNAERDRYWMQQITPTFGQTLDASLLASVLGLSASDIDATYPVQVVSTGLPTVIVPITTLDAVQTIRIDYDTYYNEFIDEFGELMLLCFTPETVHVQHDLHARVFADYSNVPEDPATGSSNGCLAGYLIEHDYSGTDELELSVEQGYEMGRPSQLYLRASRSDGEIEVHVGGSVVPVAKGELL